jgi:hypothetical protein
VDCAACEPVCSVNTIYYEDHPPGRLQPYLLSSQRFFTDAVRGRTATLGSPGGASKVGTMEVDTMVTALAPQQS